MFSSGQIIKMVGAGAVAKLTGVVSNQNAGTNLGLMTGAAVGVIAQEKYVSMYFDWLMQTSYGNWWKETLIKSYQDYWVSKGFNPEDIKTFYQMATSSLSDTWPAMLLRLEIIIALSMIGGVAGNIVYSKKDAIKSGIKSVANFSIGAARSAFGLLCKTLPSDTATLFDGLLQLEEKAENTCQPS